jgi:tol-pal system protein YbgF
MKTMATYFRQSVQAAALVAAVCFAGYASAQNRLSLADRVNRLEQQVQGGNSAQQNLTDLLGRINELQSEVQNLRGLVEQQNFELEGLKKRSRDQYLDLDTRMQSLSAGGTAAPMSMPDVARSATLSTPDQTLMSGEPNIVSPPNSNGAPSDGMALQTSEPVADAAQQRNDYDRAFDSLKQGKYAEASRQFASFIRTYPDGELVDNATYWLGESYYVTQNYKIALDTFQQLLSRYPSSGKSADALLKVGYCHHELGDSRKAQETLRSVIQRYPETPVARLAQSRLRALELEAR